MKQKNQKLSKAERILGYAFLGLSAVYFVLLAFGTFIFGPENAFYRSFNIFSGAGDPNPVIRILSYTFFVFGVSYVVRL